MRAWLRHAAPFMLLACSGDSSDGDCLATDPNCGTTQVSYEILLKEAPADLGALLIRVDAGGQAITLQMKSPNGRLAQAAGNAQGTSWRGLLLGRPTSFDLGIVTSLARLSGAPTATVEQAAGDSRSGYALIPVNSVKLEVRVASQ